MKRTDMMVACGQEGKYGTTVYRCVITDGERYFVRWNGKLVDVTEDIKNRNYTRKWLVR